MASSGVLIIRLWFEEAGDHRLVGRIVSRTGTGSETTEAVAGNVAELLEATRRWIEAFERQGKDLL